MSFKTTTLSVASLCLLSEIKCQFPNKTHAAFQHLIPACTFSFCSRTVSPGPTVAQRTAHCLPRHLPTLPTLCTCCPSLRICGTALPRGKDFSAWFLCTPRPHRTTRWVPILPLPLSQELQQSSLQSAPNLVPECS